MIKRIFKGLLIFLISILQISVVVCLAFIIGSRLGLITLPRQVSGSSMNPTLIDQQLVHVRLYDIPIVDRILKPPQISRGDIVTFSNDQTKIAVKDQEKVTTTFIKRVVAVAGDTVEIKNGYLYVNGKIPDEPYTAQPRSTFGHESTPDCKVVNIPPDKIFAMGDNRKRSEDSRDIGLVDLKDIEQYIPFSDQISEFKPRWRNTTDDLTASQSSFFDPAIYLKLVNGKRIENNLKPLRLDEKLSKSAILRARAILRSNDSSYEATKSGYPMTKSMANAGYSNIVYGEHTVFGYYDSQELFDYIFEFPKNEDFYLNKDYEDLGIGTMVGNFNGCPVQIVVQQLAGYVPPNYKPDVIASWQTALTRLKDIQPGWQSIKTWGKFYDDNKTDVDQINDIISQRIDNISGIVQKMTANEWLTPAQENYLDLDSKLAAQQDSLATKLNQR